MPHIEKGKSKHAEPRMPHAQTLGALIALIRCQPFELKPINLSTAANLRDQELNHLQGALHALGQ